MRVGPSAIYYTVLCTVLLATLATPMPRAMTRRHHPRQDDGPLRASNALNNGRLYITKLQFCKNVVQYLLYIVSLGPCVLESFS